MKKLLKMMFYSRGVLFMPYVYSFAFLVMIIIYMIVKLVAPLGHEIKVIISDTLLRDLFYGVIGLIGVSTWGRSKNPNPKWDGIPRRDNDEDTKLG